VINFTDTACTLKAEEQEIAQLLGEVWNLYCKLPLEHPNDKQEFGTAIHNCQNIILSRPAVRALAEKGQGYKRSKDNGTEDVTATPQGD
jgi:hypothetical protein